MRSMRSNDQAENSIMQTISIAVSAILIAAGLVTAPSLINNARDTNAQGDLANIAYSQESRLADRGSYATSVSGLKTDGVKLTLASPGSDIALQASSSAYASFVTSKSGVTFWRTDSDTKVHRVASPWPKTAPTGWPQNLAWPSSLTDARQTDFTNLVTDPSPTDGDSNWAAAWDGDSAGTGSSVISYVPSGKKDGRTMMRKTFSNNVSPTSTGFGLNNIAIPGPGTYTIGYTVRSSVDQKMRFSPQYYINGSSTRAGGPAAFFNTVDLRAGQLTDFRFTVTITDPSARTLGFSDYVAAPGEGAVPWPNGSTYDIGYGLVTAGVYSGDFADGNSPGWSWSGAANKSTSSGKLAD